MIESPFNINWKHDEQYMIKNIRKKIHFLKILPHRYLQAAFCSFLLLSNHPLLHSYVVRTTVVVDLCLPFLFFYFTFFTYFTIFYCLFTNSFLFFSKLYFSFVFFIVSLFVITITTTITLLFTTIITSTVTVVFVVTTVATTATTTTASSSSTSATSSFHPRRWIPAKTKYFNIII